MFEFNARPLLPPILLTSLLLAVLSLSVLLSQSKPAPEKPLLKPSVSITIGKAKRHKHRPKVKIEDQFKPGVLIIPVPPEPGSLRWYDALPPVLPCNSVGNEWLNHACLRVSDTL